MDAFDQEKNQALLKDKSKKGSVDELIKPIIDKINSFPEYYTTSSCSGRIIVFRYGMRKNEAEWLFVSHDFVDSLPLDNFSLDNNVVWLKVDPMIVHVCCRDIEAVNKFLLVARKMFKIAGIISIKNKVTIEVRGSERMELPLIKDGKLLFTEESLSLILEEANKKLEKSHRSIEVFCNALKNF